MVQTREMGQQNSGRCRQVVAIRRWLLAQVWLYIAVSSKNQNYYFRLFVSLTLLRSICTLGRCPWVTQVSISSTFNVQIFCTNVVLAAFSSYFLTLAKNLYKKRARIMLTKLTTGATVLGFINLHSTVSNSSPEDTFELFKVRGSFLPLSKLF